MHLNSLVMYFFHIISAMFILCIDILITTEIPIVCFVKFRYTPLFLTSLEPHISKMEYSL